MTGFHANNQSGLSSSTDPFVGRGADHSGDQSVDGITPASNRYNHLDSCDETSPLLGFSLLPNESSSTVSVAPSLSQWQRIRVITLCAIATLILDFGVTVIAAPKVRMFESIICNNYYRSLDDSMLHSTMYGRDGISEDQCKIPPVQSALANIIGWQVLFDGIPGGYYHFSKVIAQYFVSFTDIVSIYSNSIGDSVWCFLRLQRPETSSCMLFPGLDTIDCMDFFYM